MTTEAVPITELDTKLIKISPLQTKKWNFKKEGKVVAGSLDYCEVYYGDGGEKLSMSIDGGKIGGGGVNTQHSLMSVKHDQKTADMVRDIVDKVIKTKLVKNRKNCLSSKINEKLSKSKSQKEEDLVNTLDIMYTGVVRDGKLKDDKDPSQGRYDSEIGGTLAMTKIDGQLRPDPDMCPFIDIHDAPYMWTQCAGKEVDEYVIEIDKISFKDGNVNVKCKFRMVCIKDKAVKKFVSRKARMKESVVPREVEAKA